MAAPTERATPLWILPASPTIWAAHFLTSYITGAVWCGKLVPPGGSLATVRAGVAVYTVVALAAIAIVGGIGVRWHRLHGGEPPHDADSPEDRQRFLGLATMLLSGLSAVAVIFTALVVVFVRTCE